MKDARKITAAVAAVMQHIKAEEEAMAMQSAIQAEQSWRPISARQSAATAKVWGLNGRQAQMQMRSLMQLRTFRKL